MGVVSQTTHYQCDACRKEADTTSNVWADQSIPEGWRDADYGTFCSVECAREGLTQWAIRRADRMFGLVEQEVA